MKLVVPKTVKREERSRRGRSSRAKGASFERTVAKKFQEKYGVELVRTPMSGGFAKNKKSAEGFKGDIVPADNKVKLRLHIECKSQKTWNIHKWIDQAKSDCPKGKIPAVIARRFGTQQIYAILPLDGLFSLVPDILERKR